MVWIDAGQELAAGKLRQGRWLSGKSPYRCLLRAHQLGKHPIVQPSDDQAVVIE